MAQNIFMTGVPGFIGKRLVTELFRISSDLQFIFLVQDKFLAKMPDFIAGLEKSIPGAGAKCSWVSGDITRKNLGLSSEDLQRLQKSVNRVWHLAAIYDLSVPEEVAKKINVEGTMNVLDFCAGCSDFERLEYVSTCYVSGDRTGRVMESELDEAQTFKNNYESTKFAAEVEVHKRMATVPAVIYRPAIVVGDSRTGETDKYDGLYYMIKFLDLIPRFLPGVSFGEGHSYFNIVPVDFLVRAMAHIHFKPEAKGLTVQLADPNPHTSRELTQKFLELLGFNGFTIPLPADFVETVLKNRWASDLVKVPHETLTYLNIHASYDTANQKKLLADSDIRCPDSFTYAPLMVKYLKANPEKLFLDGRKF